MGRQALVFRHWVAKAEAVVTLVRGVKTTLVESEGNGPSGWMMVVVVVVTEQEWWCRWSRVRGVDVGADDVIDFRAGSHRYLRYTPVWARLGVMIFMTICRETKSTYSGPWSIMNGVLKFMMATITIHHES